MAMVFTIWGCEMNWLIGLFIIISVVIVIGGFTANRMSDIQSKIEDD